MPRSPVAFEQFVTALSNLLATTSALAKVRFVVAFPFMGTQSKTKRGKRGKAYRITVNEHSHTVPASEWQYAVSHGWVVPIDGEKVHLARLADGVIARMKNGVMWLESKIKQATTWIYTSWISIERNSPVIQGEYYRRQIERDHCGPRVVVREPEGTWIDRCDWPRTLERACPVGAANEPPPSAVKPCGAT